MPQVRKLLIAIANGAHVRFVRPAATRPPHGTEAADPGTARRCAAAPGADGPGAAFHGPAAADPAAAAHRDPYLLENQMFAKVVAGQLNAAAQRQEFDDLILVAPPRTLQTICDALDATTRARVVATLEKDHVQAPAYVLPPAIQAQTSQADAAPAPPARAPSHHYRATVEKGDR